MGVLNPPPNIGGIFPGIKGINGTSTIGVDGKPKLGVIGSIIFIGSLTKSGINSCTWSCGCITSWIGVILCS